MSPKTRFWLPSLADVLFTCVFLVLSFKGGNSLLNDADTGYHIRTGEYIIHNLAVPSHDIFSFITPPLPWFAHEWLSEVVMAWLHQIGGLTTVVIFFSLAIAFAYFLLFKSAQSLNCNLLLALVVVSLAALSSALHWLARPHIFSLILTVVWYRILDDYQYKDRHRLFYLPALMLLWVNLHGGFILGLLLLGIYLGGNAVGSLFSKDGERKSAREKCRKLAVAAAACLLVSLLNPRGYSILLFPFRMVSNKFLMDNVIEFLPPSFHDPLPYKYLLLLAVGVLSLARSIGLIELMLVLLFTYMSLYSARYIPLFAVVMTPILLRGSQTILGGLDHRVVKFFQKRSDNLALVDGTAKGHLWPIVSVAVVCALALTGKIEFKFDATKNPVAAVEFLKREPLSGRMFNDDEFGDYLIYAAWPQYKVFFDGRSDMYGDAWGDQYVTVARLRPNWESVVEKNHFSWIFFGTGTPLTAVLLEKKNWRLIYADKIAEIFVKDIPENSALIDKYPGVRPPPDL